MSSVLPVRARDVQVKTMMRVLALLRSVTVLALAACAADNAPSAGHTVVDSAGIRIVESFTPAWGEPGRRIEPEPFLRIGEADAEGPYQFGRLVDAALLSDGHIAVADIQAGEVRIFDDRGRHVTTLGRKGGGPGEFGLLNFVAEYPGDSIAAFDQRLDRTTIFPRAPGEPRTLLNPVQGNFMAFGLLGNGSILLYSPGEFRPGRLPGLQWDSSDVVLVHAADGSSDVVARLPVREQVFLPDGHTRELTPAHTSIRAVAHDGFYWATSDRYEIRFYDPEGSVRRIIRRPVEPQRVNDAMIAEYEAGMLDYARAVIGEHTLPDLRRRFQEGTYGELAPLFGTAFVDGDQRLWVSESSWPTFDGPLHRWSIFSPDGIWLGDVEAPERLRVMDARGGVVLGIWHDDLDVPYIQLHRLTGG